MERKRNYIKKVQDWADDRLRRMCGRITPGKRLAVILVMFFFFGGLSIYITVSSIYNIGKRDGRRLQIEHIKQYPLHDSDSINLLNRLNQAVENSNKTNHQKALDNPNNKRAIALLKNLVKEDRSLSEMARILNSEGFVSSKGCQFRASQVSILLKRYNLKED